MARNEILCHAPPEAAFAVLADPRVYGYVVVGSRTVRRFHPAWPAPGSEFHHRLGVGVTLIRDITESLEADLDRRLRLRAHMRPWSVKEIVFELAPHRGGTRVVMIEQPVAGPASVAGARLVVDRLLWLRNVVVLRRLRRVVERRTLQAGDARLRVAGWPVEGG